MRPRIFIFIIAVLYNSRRTAMNFFGVVHDPTGRTSTAPGFNSVARQWPLMDGHEGEIEFGKHPLRSPPSVSGWHVFLAERQKLIMALLNE